MKKITYYLLLLFLLNFSKNYAQVLTYNNSVLIPSTAGNVNAKKIIKDTNGNSIIVGDFIGIVDFDFSSATYNVTSEGTYLNTFILKLSPTGDFIFVKTFSGSTTNAKININDIIVDNANIYITGSFFGTVDFDPSSAVLNKSILSGSYNNTSDFYIGKYDLNMNPIWVQTSGSNASDYINSFAVDSVGNIHAVGLFAGTTDFDSGSGTTILYASGGSGAKYDGFYWELAADGSFLNAFKMGGIYYDDARKILVDNQNILIMGVYSNVVDFDPSAATNSMTAVGGTDTFILKLDLNKNYISSCSIGAEAKEMEKDSNGNLFLVGLNNSQYEDFDPSSGVAYLEAANASRFFIVKLSSSYTFNWVKSYGYSAYANGQLIDFKIDATDNLYTLGRFKNVADFDPGTEVYDIGNSNSGYYHTFIQKLDNNGNFMSASAFWAFVSDEEYLNDMYINSSSIQLVGQVTNNLYVDPNNNVLLTNASGQADALLLNLGQASLNTNSFTKSKMSIYPNPIANYLNLKLDNSINGGTLKIFSITGQSIFEKQNLNGDDFNFDVSALQTGNYLLQLSDTKNNFSSKLIKK